ncbi:hypothetical protein JEQ12_003526 [Ovis aries]|nr:hypothetical protein JEQ12_003526 [Ovis aries]
MCVSGAMRMEPGFSQNGADPAPVLSSPRSQSEKATNQVPGLLDQCLTRLLSGLLIDSGFFLQVTSQRAGWRMLIFLLMCLLPAASALTGPRLVSGESGGAVTIRCRYPRSAINSHQRKYWCRLRPSTGVCRTIVSTNHYTHLRYRGRVALADFPKRGLFVVRLSQLTPEDEGRYRCGLGSSNNALFLSMNLTVSPGQGRRLAGQRVSGREELLRDPDSSLVGAVPAYAGDPCSVEKEAPEEKELSSYSTAYNSLMPRTVDKAGKRLCEVEKFRELELRAKTSLTSPEVLTGICKNRAQILTLAGVSICHRNHLSCEKQRGENRTKSSSKTGFPAPAPSDCFLSAQPRRTVAGGRDPREPPAMSRLFLACLLAVFPAVSMKSPIFGPEEVTSVEGRSVSITCYYPATSVNRHTRKYWCRQGAKGRCTTLISSEGYVSDDYVGRANLTNFPESGTFVVDISHLTRNDSGRYKCGLGISSRGLNFDVSLEVSQDPAQASDAHIYPVDVGRTVTINCPFTSANSQKRKSLCKKTGQDCFLIIDSTGYVSGSYTGRIRLNIAGTNTLMFSVVINRVPLSDSGMYVCQAGDDAKADKSNVYLQVLEPEPELVYRDLRSSVTFDCSLGPEVADTAKFLCQQKNGEACNVVINTLGKKAQDFQGRILFLPKDNGVFSVHIASLRKEDAGRYVCGAQPEGQPEEGWPVQAWELFVNEETAIPASPSVVKGVKGGSVTVSCPYNPKDANSAKYWCRWEETQNGRCPRLVQSKGLVKEQYKGRLALLAEPGNGTYTVILNQLTDQDTGFYWCVTDGDTSWTSTVQLKVVEGEPSLKVPKNVTAWLGEAFKLSCHFPCKFYSFEKYWCKWSNEGCSPLPTQNDGPSQAFVSCDQNSQIVSLNLDTVTKEDEGWYWCGVKEGPRYGETAAVYVAVESRAKGSQDAKQVNAAPAGAAIESRAGEIQNKALLDPRLFVEEIAVKDAAGGPGAPADPGRPAGHSGSSKVLVSTLVPLALVLAAGVVAIGVLRARHRKNVDRISIRSYRTDISMSDFENSRDFEGRDNMGASPEAQETSLGGKDEFATATEDTVESKEPKKAKRSSKEEADEAFTTFLLQAKNLASTTTQDGPTEA